MWLAFAVTAGALLPATSRAAQNELTPQEKAEGWKLLFDGATLQGWHHFKKPGPPARGWTVEAGILKLAPKSRAGDLITEAAFDDFDLQWEWRIAPGANSGVKYFISETRSSPIGHEYQLIDDDVHPDAKVGDGKHVTAGVYDVLKPVGATPKPPGEWNHSRVVARGKQVEHWLNGKKVLSYELESEALKAAIAASKFKTTPGFGTKIRGHILLQDHGDEVAFRNIKIRELRNGSSP